MQTRCICYVSSSEMFPEAKRLLSEQQSPDYTSDNIRQTMVSFSGRSRDKIEIFPEKSRQKSPV